MQKYLVMRNWALKHCVTSTGVPEMRLQGKEAADIAEDKQKVMKTFGKFFWLTYL